MSRRPTSADDVQILAVFAKNRREAIRVGVIRDGNRQRVELRICALSPDGKRISPKSHVMILRAEQAAGVAAALQQAVGMFGLLPAPAIAFEFTVIASGEGSQ